MYIREKEYEKGTYLSLLGTLKGVCAWEFETTCGCLKGVALWITGLGVAAWICGCLNGVALKLELEFELLFGISGFPAFGAAKVGCLKGVALFKLVLGFEAIFKICRNGVELWATGWGRVFFLVETACWDLSKLFFVPLTNVDKNWFEQKKQRISYKE